LKTEQQVVIYRCGGYGVALNTVPWLWTPSRSVKRNVGSKKCFK